MDELIIPKNTFSVLEEDAKELFLLYLNKTINLYSENGWNSDGGLQEDGSYLETASITLKISEYKLPFTWYFYWNNSTQLDYIKIVINCDVNFDWKNEIRNIIQETLFLIIACKKETHFLRSTFAYFGSNLNGEYWVNSRLRIAPAKIETTGFYTYITENVLYIDQVVEGIDKTHAFDIGRLKAKRISSLLSLLLGIGLYQIPIERRWFYQGENETGCYQLGFKRNHPENMPKKGTECKIGKCQLIPNTTEQNDTLMFPQEYRKFFKSIDQNLNALQKKAIYNASALYQVALTAGRYYRSIRLSYQVAAIDALNVGIKRDKKSFVKIIKEYRPETAQDEIDLLYDKIRCAHFHEGIFPGGEYDLMHIRIGMNPTNLYKSNHYIMVDDICREVLINWTYRNVINLDS